MKVEIGIKSDPIEYRYSYAWLFQLMENLSVRNLQLGTTFEIYQLPDSYFIRLRAEAASHGIRIHSCFSAHRELGGLLSQDRDIQSVTQRSFRRLAEIGVLVGAQSIGTSMGSVLRDQMDSKRDAIERYPAAVSGIAEYAGQIGLEALTLEAMSSLAEPPSTPSEITDIMNRLNPNSPLQSVTPLSRVPIYLCSDVSHGLADETGSVVHSHMELFEQAIPWTWEFHFKNTDARFESTFGFGPADSKRGVVDLSAVATLIRTNDQSFPREVIVGYLEIPGPKLGRDYSDRLLGDQITDSIRAIGEVFQ